MQDDSEKAFTEGSLWADDVDDREMSEYHFVHTSDLTCAAYSEERCCGFGGSDRCLVTGITKYAGDFLGVELGRLPIDWLS